MSIKFFRSKVELHYNKYQPSDGGEKQVYSAECMGDNSCVPINTLFYSEVGKHGPFGPYLKSLCSEGFCHPLDSREVNFFKELSLEDINSLDMDEKTKVFNFLLKQ